MVKWTKFYIYLNSMVLLLAAVATGSEMTRQPLDMATLAKESGLSSDLGRTEAAQIAQYMIMAGQNKNVLGRYVGISPQINATVTADEISWQISYFDGYSRQPPIAPKIAGAPIRPFTAHWDQVTQVKMELVSEEAIGKDWNYLAVTLTKSNASGGCESSELPLNLNPGGYTNADVALVFSVLGCKDNKCSPPVPEIKAVTNSVPLPATNVVVLTRSRRHSDTVENKLKQLKDLYDKGLVSEDVYREKQREILRGL